MGALSREADGGRVWVFFALAIAWTWLLHLPGVLATRGVLELSGPVSFVLGLLATAGPGLAAFVLMRREAGGKGVRRL